MATGSPGSPATTGLDELRLQRAGGGATLLVVRSRRIDAVRFSPDSTIVGAVLSARRLRLYTLSSDTVVPVGSGFIRGWTFSPDSKAIAWGRASDPAPEAPGDIYAAPIAPGARARRVTRTKDALNPLWGAQGIIFDRQRSRPGDAPVYNLWAIQPDGSGLRRITRLKIPSLASGLVPLDLSADGSAPARRLHRPAHADHRLHRRPAKRRDARALQGCRAGPRRRRPIGRRHDDPRAHRRPRPSRSPRRRHRPLRQARQADGARTPGRRPALEPIGPG